MTVTMSQTLSREANYGWFADAIGGTAAAVLAIVGLAGVHSEMIMRPDTETAHSSSFRAAE